MFPTFTVTLLFADFAYNSPLWTDDPQATRLVLDHFHALLETIITQKAGVRFKTTIPVMGATFANAMDAVTAAVAMQKVMGEEGWATHDRLQIRIALHTGVVSEYEGEYVGRPVELARVLLAAAHGQQILLSNLTHELVREQVGGDITLRDLGAYALGAQNPPAHLFQLVVADLPASFPPLRSPAYRPHNLPLPPTPLVGRDQEITEVTARLQQDEVRLLTLTGPGGVGKSRLGLQVATLERDTFADGVFWIDLSPLHDAAQVIPTIADTLGLSEASEQPLLIHLTNALAPRHILLVLDSFEHLLAAGGALAHLLAGVPRLKLLVTSRAVLNLAGEHEFALSPLALPEAEDSLSLSQADTYGAVTLFLQRARAVKPNFVLTEENLSTIIEICRRVDGLPLGIELAAARCKLFPLSVLLQRLAVRLPILTGGTLDHPPRHRTLRDTIDWSYQLLENHTQRLLQQIALFEGGCTLETIEVVCRGDDTLAGIVLEGLATLIDQSLLRHRTQGGTSRFILLDTIREFALERLGESGSLPSLRERHTAYYVQLAEQAEFGLQGLTMQSWLDRLEREYANLRAVVLWNLAQGNLVAVARLASALRFFWEVRAHRHEGRIWLEATLSTVALLPIPLRAKTLHAIGRLARALYDPAAAEQRLQESITLYETLGDVRGQTAALTDLGWTLVTLGGDSQRAKPLLEEGLARYRALEDERGMAWALYGLGWVELRHALGDQPGSAWALVELAWVEREQGSLVIAKQRFSESLSLRREVQDSHDVAWSLASLALVAAGQQQYEAARRYTEERLTIEQQLNNYHGIAGALQQLGVIAFRQGDRHTARAWLLEGVALARDLGDTYVLALTLMGLGEIYQVEGEPHHATTVFTEALTLFQELHDPQRMARVYARLAQVALEQNNRAVSHTFAMQSLQIAREVKDLDTITMCLAGIADSAAQQGRWAWAAHLWGTAEALQESTTVPRIPVEPPHRPSLMHHTRTALGETTFQGAWAVGRTLSPEEVLVIPEASVDPHPLVSTATATLVGLTPREMEVLLLVAEGISNDQIALRLNVSVATIKTHLTAVYRKIGVSSRSAAMRYVIDHQL